MPTGSDTACEIGRLAEGRREVARGWRLGPAEGFAALVQIGSSGGEAADRVLGWSRVRAGDGCVYLMKASIWFQLVDRVCR